MRRKTTDKSILQVIAQMTLVCFITTTVSWSAPIISQARAQSITPSVQTSPVAPQQELPLALQIQIPNNFGAVRERWLATSVDGPWTMDHGQELVIHFQDAHGYYEAQANTEKMISELIENYGVHLIGVEGAEGKLPIESLRAFPYPKAKENALHVMMQQGRMSGAEAAAILSEASVVLFGVENTGLYEKNKAIYVDTLEQREVLIQSVDVLMGDLEPLKKKHYSSELKKIDTAYQQFLEKTITPFDYLDQLLHAAQISKTDVSNYPNVGLFEQVREVESLIDFEKVNGEREALIQDIRLKLRRNARQEGQVAIADQVERYSASRKSPEQLSLTVEMLTRFVNDFRMGKVKERDFYKQLIQSGSSLDVNFLIYPNVFEYATYLDLFERIDRNALRFERRQVEKEAQKRLAKTKEQLALVELSFELVLIKKLLALEVFNEDLSRYVAEKDMFEAAVLKKKIEIFDLSPKAEQALDQLKQLSKVLSKVEQFYALADQRSDVMVNNLLKAMEEGLSLSSTKKADPSSGGRGEEHSVILSDEAQRAKESKDLPPKNQGEISPRQRRGGQNSRDSSAPKAHQNDVGVGASVLVAGGFHTELMNHILKQKKVSYLTVLPKLTTHDEQAELYYRQRMLGEVSALDQLVVSLLAEQSTLANPIRYSQQFLVTMLQQMAMEALAEMAATNTPMALEQLLSDKKTLQSLFGQLPFPAKVTGVQDMGGGVRIIELTIGQSRFMFVASPSGVVTQRFYSEVLSSSEFLGVSSQELVQTTSEGKGFLVQVTGSNVSAETLRANLEARTQQRVQEILNYPDVSPTVMAQLVGELIDGSNFELVFAQVSDMLQRRRKEASGLNFVQKFNTVFYPYLYDAAQTFEISEAIDTDVAANPAIVAAQAELAQKQSVYDALNAQSEVDADIFRKAQQELAEAQLALTQAIVWARVQNNYLPKILALSGLNAEEQGKLLQALILSKTSASRGTLISQKRGEIDALLEKLKWGDSKRKDFLEALGFSGATTKDEKSESNVDKSKPLVEMLGKSLRIKRDRLAKLIVVKIAESLAKTLSDDVFVRKETIENVNRLLKRQALEGSEESQRLAKQILSSVVERERVLKELIRAQIQAQERRERTIDENRIAQAFLEKMSSEEVLQNTGALQQEKILSLLETITTKSFLTDQVMLEYLTVKKNGVERVGHHIRFIEFELTNEKGESEFFTRAVPGTAVLSSAIDVLAWLRDPARFMSGMTADQREVLETYGRLANYYNEAALELSGVVGYEVCDRFGVNVPIYTANVLFTDKGFHEGPTGLGKTAAVFNLAAAINSKIAKDEGVQNLLNRRGNGKTLFITHNKVLYEQTVDSPDVKNYFEKIGLNIEAFNEDTLNAVQAGGEKAEDVLARLAAADAIIAEATAIDFTNLSLNASTDEDRERISRLHAILFHNVRALYDEADTVVGATGTMRSQGDDNLTEVQVVNHSLLNKLVAEAIAKTTAEEYGEKGLKTDVEKKMNIVAYRVEKKQEALGKKKAAQYTPEELERQVRLELEREMLELSVIRTVRATEEDTEFRSGQKIVKVSFSDYQTNGGTVREAKFNTDNVIAKKIFMLMVKEIIGKEVSPEDALKIWETEDLTKIKKELGIRLKSDHIKELNALKQSLVGRAEALRQLEGRQVGLYMDLTDGTEQNTKLKGLSQSQQDVIRAFLESVLGEESLAAGALMQPAQESDSERLRLMKEVVQFILNNGKPLDKAIEEAIAIYANPSRVETQRLNTEQVKSLQDLKGLGKEKFTLMATTIGLQKTIKVISGFAIAPRLRQSDAALAAHTQLIFQRFYGVRSAEELDADEGAKTILTKIQVGGETIRDTRNGTLMQFLLNGSDVSGLSGTMTHVADTLRVSGGFQVYSYRQTGDFYFADNASRQIANTDIVMTGGMEGSLKAFESIWTNPEEKRKAGLGNARSAVFADGTGLGDEKTGITDELKKRILSNPANDFDSLVLKLQTTGWVRITLNANGSLNEKPIPLEDGNGKFDVKNYLNAHKNENVALFMNLGATRGVDLVFDGEVAVFAFLDQSSNRQDVGQLFGRDRGVRLVPPGKTKPEFVYAWTKEAADGFRNGTITVQEVMDELDQPNGRFTTKSSNPETNEATYNLFHPLKIFMQTPDVQDATKFQTYEQAGNGQNWVQRLQVLLEANTRDWTKVATFQGLKGDIENSFLNFLYGIIRNIQANDQMSAADKEKNIKLLLSVRKDFQNKMAESTRTALTEGMSAVEALRNTREQVIEQLRKIVAPGADIQFNDLDTSIRQTLQEQLQQLEQTTLNFQETSNSFFTLFLDNNRRIQVQQSADGKTVTVVGGDLTAFQQIDVIDANGRTMPLAVGIQLTLDANGSVIVRIADILDAETAEQLADKTKLIFRQRGTLEAQSPSEIIQIINETVRESMLPDFAPQAGEGDAAIAQTTTVYEALRQAGLDTGPDLTDPAEVEEAIRLLQDRELRKQLIAALGPSGDPSQLPRLLQPIAYYLEQEEEKRQTLLGQQIPQPDPSVAAKNEREVDGILDNIMQLIQASKSLPIGTLAFSPMTLELLRRGLIDLRTGNVTQDGLRYIQLVAQIKNQTTEQRNQFLGAVERFFSRRGEPSQVFFYPNNTPVNEGESAELLRIINFVSGLLDQGFVDLYQLTSIGKEQQKRGYGNIIELMERIADYEMTAESLGFDPLTDAQIKTILRSNNPVYAFRKAIVPDDKEERKRIRNQLTKEGQVLLDKFAEQREDEEAQTKLQTTATTLSRLKKEQESQRTKLSVGKGIQNRWNRMMAWFGLKKLRGQELWNQYVGGFFLERKMKKRKLTLEDIKSLPLGRQAVGLSNEEQLARQILSVQEWYAASSEAIARSNAQFRSAHSHDQAVRFLSRLIPDLQGWRNFLKRFSKIEAKDLFSAAQQWEFMRRNLFSLEDGIGLSQQQMIDLAMQNALDGTKSWWRKLGKPLKEVVGTKIRKVWKKEKELLALKSKLLHEDEPDRRQRQRMLEKDMEDPLIRQKLLFVHLGLAAFANSNLTDNQKQQMVEKIQEAIKAIDELVTKREESEEYKSLIQKQKAGTLNLEEREKLAGLRNVGQEIGELEKAAKEAIRELDGFFDKSQLTWLFETITQMQRVADEKQAQVHPLAAEAGLLEAGQGGLDMSALAGLGGGLSPAMLQQILGGAGKKSWREKAKDLGLPLDIAERSLVGVLTLEDIQTAMVSGTQPVPAVVQRMSKEQKIQLFFPQAPKEFLIEALAQMLDVPRSEAEKLSILQMIELSQMFSALTSQKVLTRILPDALVQAKNLFGQKTSGRDPFGYIAQLFFGTIRITSMAQAEWFLARVKSALGKDFKGLSNVERNAVAQKIVTALIRNTQIPARLRLWMANEIITTLNVNKNMIDATIKSEIESLSSAAGKDVLEKARKKDANKAKPDNLETFLLELFGGNASSETKILIRKILAIEDQETASDEDYLEQARLYGKLIERLSTLRRDETNEESVAVFLGGVKITEEKALSDQIAQIVKSSPSLRINEDELNKIANDIAKQILAGTLKTMEQIQSALEASLFKVATFKKKAQKEKARKALKNRLKNIRVYQGLTALKSLRYASLLSAYTLNPKNIKAIEAVSQEAFDQNRNQDAALVRLKKALDDLDLDDSARERFIRLLIDNTNEPEALLELKKYILKIEDEPIQSQLLKELALKQAETDVAFEALKTLDEAHAKATAADKNSMLWTLLRAEVYSKLGQFRQLESLLKTINESEVPSELRASYLLLKAMHRLAITIDQPSDLDEAGGWLKEAIRLAEAEEDWKVAAKAKIAYIEWMLRTSGDMQKAEIEWKTLQAEDGPYVKLDVVKNFKNTMTQLQAAFKAVSSQEQVVAGRMKEGKGGLEESAGESRMQIAESYFYEQRIGSYAAYRAKKYAPEAKREKPETAQKGPNPIMGMIQSKFGAKMPEGGMSKVSGVMKIIAPLIMAYTFAGVATAGVLSGGGAFMMVSFLATPIIQTLVAGWKNRKSEDRATRMVAYSGLGIGIVLAMVLSATFLIPEFGVSAIIGGGAALWVNGLLSVLPAFAQSIVLTAKLLHIIGFVGFSYTLMLFQNPTSLVNGVRLFQVMGVKAVQYVDEKRAKVPTKKGASILKIFSKRNQLEQRIDDMVLVLSRVDKDKTDQRKSMDARVLLALQAQKRVLSQEDMGILDKVETYMLADDAAADTIAREMIAKAFNVQVPSVNQPKQPKSPFGEGAAGDLSGLPPHIVQQLSEAQGQPAMALERNGIQFGEYNPLNPSEILIDEEAIKSIFPGWQTLESLQLSTEFVRLHEIFHLLVRRLELDLESDEELLADAFARYMLNLSVDEDQALLQEIASSGFMQSIFEAEDRIKALESSLEQNRIELTIRITNFSKSTREALEEMKFLEIFQDAMLGVGGIYGEENLSERVEQTLIEQAEILYEIPVGAVNLQFKRALQNFLYLELKKNTQITDFHLLSEHFHKRFALNVPLKQIKTFFKQWEIDEKWVIETRERLWDFSEVKISVVTPGQDIEGNPLSADDVKRYQNFAIRAIPILRTVLTERPDLIAYVLSRTEEPGDENSLRHISIEYIDSGKHKDVFKITFNFGPGVKVKTAVFQALKTGALEKGEAEFMKAMSEAGGGYVPAFGGWITLYREKEGIYSTRKKAGEENKIDIMLEEFIEGLTPEKIWRKNAKNLRTLEEYLTRIITTVFSLLEVSKKINRDQGELPYDLNPTNFIFEIKDGKNTGRTVLIDAGRVVAYRPSILFAQLLIHYVETKKVDTSLKEKLLKHLMDEITLSLGVEDAVVFFESVVHDQAKQEYKTLKDYPHVLKKIRTYLRIIKQERKAKKPLLRNGIQFGEYNPLNPSEILIDEEAIKSIFPGWQTLESLQLSTEFVRLHEIFHLLVRRLELGLESDEELLADAFARYLLGLTIQEDAPLIAELNKYPSIRDIFDSQDPNAALDVVLRANNIQLTVKIMTISQESPGPSAPFGSEREAPPASASGPAVPSTEIVAPFTVGLRMFREMISGRDEETGQPTKPVAASAQSLQGQTLVVPVNFDLFEGLSEEQVQLQVEGLVTFKRQAQKYKVYIQYVAVSDKHAEEELRMMAGLVEANVFKYVEGKISKGKGQLAAQLEIIRQANPKIPVVVIDALDQQSFYAERQSLDLFWIGIQRNALYPENISDTGVAQIVTLFEAMNQFFSKMVTFDRGGKGMLHSQMTGQVFIPQAMGVKLGEDVARWLSEQQIRIAA